MGILGAFLAVGWLGGNLAKDATKTAKITPAMNASLPDRIEWRNGNYYDTVTGKRVRREFFTDPITGIKNTTAWVNAKTGCVIYVPSREKYFEEQEVAKKEIERLKAEKDAVWLQEAIDNNDRFAKVILPFRDGVCNVAEGYYDRKQIVENEEDRVFYFANKWGFMYKAIIENGYWKPNKYGSYWKLSERYDKNI